MEGKYEFDEESRLWTMKRRSFLFLSGMAMVGTVLAAPQIKTVIAARPIGVMPLVFRTPTWDITESPVGFSRPVPVLYDWTGKMLWVERDGERIALQLVTHA